MKFVAKKAMTVADIFIAKSFQYLRTDSLKPRDRNISMLHLIMLM